MKKKMSLHRAQTATELAIFGAIIIFVLGLIVRYAMSFNYNQDRSLKAMRQAFQGSFLSSEKGSSARRVASTLVIEDRKEVANSESPRYGSLSRNPIVVSGSGSFTKHLLRPLSDAEYDQLPLIDMYINGTHLTFTTVGFGYKDLTEDINSQPEDCFESGWPGVKCALFYTKIAYEDSKFCSHEKPGCTLAEMDDRFDLDRDGTPDVPANPPDLRNNFSWQWYPVKMIAPDVDFETGKILSVDLDGDLKEEEILAFEDELGNSYALDDIDMETDSPNRRETRILDRGAVIKKIWYADEQSGDIDSSYNTADENNGVPRPGLQPGMAIYSLMPGGTYFIIEEGRLYTPDRQFVRHAQKRDRIDVIERKIQLSNIAPVNNANPPTPRMCAAPLFDPGPVEACCGAAGGTCSAGGSCCYGSNTFKTCFDLNCKMLYVRSRISEKAGRKWITDVSADQMPVK